MATKKPIKTVKITGQSTLLDRKKRGENQLDFWQRLGVTQSGGSRYESETDVRQIPRPVRMLIALETGKATIEQLRSGALAEMVS